VLSGDPETGEATLAELVARREAAAEVMDFERAATIQEELEGLIWILEPSRVLEPAPDQDLHGWSDGVLLTLSLRDGRICDWTSRRCAERDAQGLLAATPDRWRTFATQNAALAAALLAATQGSVVRASL
jgi:excinuclease ABC subunit C